MHGGFQRFVKDTRHLDDSDDIKPNSGKWIWSFGQKGFDCIKANKQSIVTADQRATAKSTISNNSCARLSLGACISLGGNAT